LSVGKLGRFPSLTIVNNASINMSAKSKTFECQLYAQNVFDFGEF
jgi:hypothetical protein